MAVRLHQATQLQHIQQRQQQREEILIFLAVLADLKICQLPQQLLMALLLRWARVDRVVLCLVDQQPLQQQQERDLARVEAAAGLAQQVLIILDGPAMQADI
jgi:hypothetical protein